MSSLNLTRPFDIVFFWKQNDSDIYGRRQDMIVEYLSQHQRIGRILHFDSPIALGTLGGLLDLSKGRYLRQSKFIFRQTVLRVLHLRDSDRVRRRTFLYNDRPQNKLELLNKLRLRRESYLEFLQKEIDGYGIDPTRSLFWVCPRNFEFPSIVKRFKPGMVVADVIDDHRTWPMKEHALRKLQDNYEQILGSADLSFTNCESVHKSMRDLCANIRVIPNGVDLNNSSSRRYRIPRVLKGMGRPIVGYVGNLGVRIDVDLLEHLADERPEWNLCLVGSVHAGSEILRLRSKRNVHFLGVIPYSKITRYVQAFDVAIIPHMDNEMTRNMNPLKLYVYLANKIPVVSTRVSNLDTTLPGVRVARDNADFVTKVDQAIEERSEKSFRDPDDGILARVSWASRIEEIVSAIDDTIEKSN